MTNEKLYLETNKGKRALFAPFDFHVHTLGSADVRIGQRYDKLPQTIRDVLPKLTKDPSDLAAYDAEIGKVWAAADYYNFLVAKKASLFDGGKGPGERRNLAVIALTDHNVYKYSCAIAEIGKAQFTQHKLIILPGVELDVEFKVDQAGDQIRIHILCIFAPDVQESDIRLAISSALEDPDYKPGGVITANSLPSFISNLRSHRSYPSMCR